jgi:outer membrane protein insertion porin family
MTLQNLREKSRIFVTFLLVLPCLTIPYTCFADQYDREQHEDIDEKIDQKIIESIVVSGNKHVPIDVILNRIPYKKNDIFDAEKSPAAINNLYALGYFRQIELEGESLPDNRMNLHIIVEEKKLLERFQISGTKVLSKKKIKEKLNLGKLVSIDEETLHRIAIGIKKMYKEEHRHAVQVETKIIDLEENPDKAIAVLEIDEGPRSTVARVYFKGNKNIPDRQLRTFAFTREDWLLSFMDSAGTYNEEMIEADKHRIELFYRDRGYLMAKVGKVDAEFSPDHKQISITFHINEGELFTVRSVQVPGDDLFTEKELLPQIIIKEGDLYSYTKLIQSMNRLKDVWGEKGYIYADVYPQVKPDEEHRKVDITFHVERGNKMFVNRINITGNKVTRDKVIRRQIDIDEGELITTRQLNRSKTSVEYLSFFEREGVEWRIHRINDELADLELHVKETKTGQFNFMLTYGSDPHSSKQSLRGSLSLNKSNLFGLGYDVGALVQASRHHIQRLETHFFDPHIGDSDVSGYYLFYWRWDEFDQWKNVNHTPKQRVIGGNVRFGFGLPKIDRRAQVLIDLGIENIDNNHPAANGADQKSFAPIVRRTFQRGTLSWIGLDIIKDTRDHQIYPTSGYKWKLSSKIAPTGINDDFSFFKNEFEASYYTPLIGRDSLVLALHAKIGNVESISSGKIIPYKELFHMGGQTTVRGFVWGGIGPAWDNGSPIGARNALLFNTELVFPFPMVADESMKGHVFYDAGAGWNTPKDDIEDPSHIRRDKFDLRHAVGFGINLLKPMPAKIDWGFKLDRKKKDHESAHEFHLSMNYAW